MPRCTGKTDIHNLEPEDLRAISVATAQATGMPLAGKNLRLAAVVAVTARRRAPRARARAGSAPRRAAPRAAWRRPAPRSRRGRRRTRAARRCGGCGPARRGRGRRSAGRRPRCAPRPRRRGRGRCRRGVSASGSCAWARSSRTRRALVRRTATSAHAKQLDRPVGRDAVRACDLCQHLLHGVGGGAAAERRGTRAGRAADEVGVVAVEQVGGAAAGSREVEPDHQRGGSGRGRCARAAWMGGVDPGLVPAIGHAVKVVVA